MKKYWILFELETILEKIFECNPLALYAKQVRIKELGDFWVSWKKSVIF